MEGQRVVLPPPASPHAIESECWKEGSYVLYRNSPQHPWFSGLHSPSDRELTALHS